MTQPTVLIRRKTLLERVPYTDRHILNLEKKGLFPKRRVLGPRCVAWVESEVAEWMASRSTGVGMVPMSRHESSGRSCPPSLAA